MLLWCAVCCEFEEGVLGICRSTLPSRDLHGWLFGFLTRHPADGERGAPNIGPVRRPGAPASRESPDGA